MSLATGTRLGPYEILAPLGAGGMGEVYRARDTKLKREVALKVLPEHFTADPERLARFQREAEVLASLNHPHIAHIHGLEESEGVRALVLELVGGPTLADRLAQGRIPIAEALAIARQIADALEAAHDQGIIHRDLKPANVKLRRDGTVKVLDFGLAKAIAGESAAPILANSPTVSGVATRHGVLLGTAAYMSPEQARGLALDARTDIFSFGCLLYEMLAGRMAFGAATVTDTLSAIVSREPDWQALPADTPETVRRVLRYCLEKDARRRLRHIADARLQIEDAHDSAPRVLRPARRMPSLVALGVVLLVAVISSVALWRWLDRPREIGDTIVFTIERPRDTESLAGIPAPSPDGRHVAFVAVDSAGRRSIWLRPADSDVSRRIEGTEDISGGTLTMFWAPDGRSLGFFADGRLRRVDIAGGPVQNIAPVTANLGATWNAGGIIVVAPHNRVPLHKVPASGGTPQPFTVLDTERRENSHRWPSFLPDGRHFLYTARSDVKENTGIYVGSLDSPERKWLVAAQSRAQYAEPGYLLFVRDGTLMAQRFDIETLELAGGPVGLVGDVEQASPSANASFGLSTNGRTLSYGRSAPSSARLTWFDRSGTRLGTLGPDIESSDQLRLAPDGRRAAIVSSDPESGNRDIWAIDVATGTLSRLTSHPATDWRAVWSPDGMSIAFASDRNGRSSLFRKRAEPTAAEEPLLEAAAGGGRFISDWSADGRFVIFHQDVQRETVSTDVWALPLSGDRKPFPMVETRFREAGARVSPNGRWLAYVSDESGRDEVYVKAFETPDARRISPSGARNAVWRRDGRELFFLGFDYLVMAVTWDDNAGAPAGMPRPLFRICDDLPVAASYGDRFDVTSDGQRFLVTCRSGNAPAPAITVIVNWRGMLENRTR